MNNNIGLKPKKILGIRIETLKKHYILEEVRKYLGKAKGKRQKAKVKRQNLW